MIILAFFIVFELNAWSSSFCSLFYFFIYWITYSKMNKCVTGLYAFNVVSVWSLYHWADEVKQRAEECDCYYRWCLQVTLQWHFTSSVWSLINLFLRVNFFFYHAQSVKREVIIWSSHFPCCLVDISSRHYMHFLFSFSCTIVQYHQYHNCTRYDYAVHAILDLTLIKKKN